MPLCSPLHYGVAEAQAMTAAPPPTIAITRTLTNITCDDTFTSTDNRIMAVTGMGDFDGDGIEDSLLATSDSSFYFAASATGVSAVATVTGGFSADSYVASMVAINSPKPKKPWIAVGAAVPPYSPPSPSSPSSVPPLPSPSITTSSNPMRPLWRSPTLSRPVASFALLLCHYCGRQSAAMRTSFPSKSLNLRKSTRT